MDEQWTLQSFLRTETEILLLGQQQNGYAFKQPWEWNSLDKSHVILDSDLSPHISKVDKKPFSHLETFPGNIFNSAGG